MASKELIRFVEEHKLHDEYNATANALAAAGLPHGAETVLLIVYARAQKCRRCEK